MSNKVKFAILMSIALVVIVLSAIVIKVAFDYNSTVFSEAASFDESYVYRNGVLYANEADKALLYIPEGGSFESFTVQTADLGRFGLEGQLDYFIIDGTIVPDDPAYNFFYASNTDSRFTYIAPDGRKYRVGLTDSVCVPLFDGSKGGIDVYATDIDAISPDGAYAVDIRDSSFDFYCRTETEDTAVSEVKNVPFTDEMTEGVTENLGFINNTILFFRSGGRYFLCDAQSGEIADCYIDDANYKSTAVSRYFVEEILTDEQKNSDDFKDFIVLKYRYLFSDNEFVVKLDKSLYSEATLRAVSPDGMYALLDVTAQPASNASSGVMIYRIGKKCAVLNDFFPETENAEDIFFIYNNILFVNYRGSAKCYKVCF